MLLSGHQKGWGAGTMAAPANLAESKKDARVGGGGEQKALPTNISVQIRYQSHGQSEKNARLTGHL